MEPETQNMSSHLIRISELEHANQELRVKLLKSLDLIHAISSNTKKTELTNIYTQLLSDKLNVSRFVLLLNTDKWEVSAQFQAECPPQDCVRWVSATQSYNGLRAIDYSCEPDFLRPFNYMLTVWHSSTRHIAVLYFFMDTQADPAAETDKDLVKAVTSTLAIGLENKRLFNEARESRAIQDEADLAGSQLRDILPKQLPNTPEYRFTEIFMPHNKDVGGDFYDCFEIQNQVIFVIADVSGKGWQAAMVAMTAMGALRACYHNSLKLEEIVENLNHVLYASTGGDKYLTMFIGKWCPQTTVLEYINAGHPSPYLFMEDKVHRLETGCTIIGDFSDLGTVDVGRISIAGRALLLTFTDGLTEFNSGKNFEDNSARFEEIISRNSHLPMDAFKQCLIDFIDAYEADTMVTDDLTVLLGEFLSTAHAE
jgi:sigma-B regulation protein RsbU (phosphoserine phosphatase)